MADPAVVKALRDRVGFGLRNCFLALDACGGDELLAEGYLKHNGLAVCIHDEHGNPSTVAYARWVMEQALRFKARTLLSRPPVDLVALWPPDCFVPVLPASDFADLLRRLDHNNRAWTMLHDPAALRGRDASPAEDTPCATL